MLSNLRAEMARKRITGIEIGKCIGRSEKTVSSKINERSEFTRREMFLIKSNLFPDVQDMRYLFESDMDAS